MSQEARVRQNRARLVVAARGGDREAMGLLIEQELPWIRGVIAGYVDAHDAVDDICQDVFVSAWLGIGKLRNAEGFKSWLYRIAVNKVRSHFRGLGRRATTPLIDEIAPGGAGSTAERSDRREVLHTALQKLPAKYRDPLVIHYLNERSCDETARILGLRPVTARIRLLRGRRKLEEILRKDGVL